MQCTGTILDDIIKENARRKAVFETPYDPVSGVGSPLRRVNLYFTVTKRYEWGIPEQMLDLSIIQQLIKCGGDVHTCLEQNGIVATGRNKLRFLQELVRTRCKYDFEFWVSQCVKIVDKETGLEIFFILNQPQRKLLKVFEDERLSEKPIRVILLKARQWGGSTLTQIYIEWIQRFWRENWNSVIIGNVEEQARTIRAMYSLVARRHPSEIASFTLKNFEGSSKNKVLSETNSVISIGSMEKPENLRSTNIALAHLSEISFWKKTESKRPEDVIQTITGSVSHYPFTFICKESTAKGVGNYFHNSWLAAKNRKSTDIPVFVGWFEIKMYQMPLDVPVGEFVASLTNYEEYLWHLGATLEGIQWYRWKLAGMLYDEWRMQAEFPSTDNEAFQSTGARVFPPSYVQNMRKHVITPEFVGEVFADSSTGVDAMKNIHLEESKGGCLSIWLRPDVGKWVNRYVISVDTGGTTSKADYSVISVIDRYMLQFGGALERAAVWRGHIDHDRLAWKAVQLGILYHNAMIVVEKNYLDADVSNEGDASYTILNEIAKHYRYLYHTTPIDKIKPGMALNYGWHTNKSTKPLAIDTLKKLIRDDGYIEHYNVACDEADSYEWKPDGTVGAVDGGNDDVVMSTAIGVTVALDSRVLGVPHAVVETDAKRFGIRNTNII
jgi:hypothetical protein